MQVSKKRMIAISIVVAIVTPLLVGVYFGKGDVPAISMFVYSALGLAGGLFCFYKASQVKFEDRLMATIETDDMVVKYKDDAETKQRVFDAVVAFFKNQKSFSGESLYQQDSVFEHVPELLADIADDILEFDVTWKE